MFFVQSKVHILPPSEAKLDGEIRTFAKETKPLLLLLVCFPELLLFHKLLFKLIGWFLKSFLVVSSGFLLEKWEFLGHAQSLKGRSKPMRCRIWG